MSTTPTPHVAPLWRVLSQPDGGVMRNIDVNLPTFGFVVMTRALLGVGIGLLLSGRLTEEQRKAVGLTLVLVGAATTIPAAMAVFGVEAQKALAA